MKALVLCGGVPQIELLCQLKERGVTTILLDMNEKVKAREYADKFYPVSVLDVDAVRKVAVEEKVDFIMTVCADQVLEVVAQIAEEVLGSEQRPVGKKIKHWQEDMTVCQSETYRTMEVSMPTFQLGFKCEDVGWGRDSVRKEIVGDLAAEALFGESSPLYLELYEDGLIDSSFGGGFETSEDMAMLFCGGDSDDPEAVREAIVARAAQLAVTGVEEADFLRMKRSAMGRRIRDLDSFDATCFRVCANHLSKFEYFDFPGVYAEVTAEEVREFLARVVRPERMTLAVIDPIEEDEA